MTTTTARFVTLLAIALLTTVAVGLPDCPHGCQCGGDESEASEVQRECLSVATCPCGTNLSQGQFAPLGVAGFDCVIFKMPLGHVTNLNIRPDNEWLRGLPSSARRVDLAGCGVQHISDGSFSHLIETRVLNLEYNALRTIPHEAFKGMANLKVLWLTGHYLDPAAMDSESMPEYAALEPLQNAIHTVQGTAFAHNPRLTVLLLHHNDLRRLPAGVFEAQKKSLRVLKLAHNPKLPSLHAGQGALRFLERENVKQLDLYRDTGDALEDWMQQSGHYLDDNNGDEANWWSSNTATGKGASEKMAGEDGQKQKGDTRAGPGRDEAAPTTDDEAWEAPFDL